MVSLLMYLALALDSLVQLQKNSEAFLFSFPALQFVSFQSVLVRGNITLVSHSCRNFQDRFGDTKASLTHLRGALRIVEKFRDLSTIRDHHWLTMYINWLGNSLAEFFHPLLTLIFRQGRHLKCRT